MSQHLYIADSYKPLQDFTAPAMDFKYPLDPFQQHAIAAICRGENVFVTAKTGSGKTLVGEYQIAHSLAKGRRVFYTTPIKSLSNQKFNDLKNLFGAERVGIMTGDIKFQPDAPIVIMTTEILRNLLYKQGTSTASLGLSASLNIDGLDAVIFDEVHYINNKERGRVWEETMILLPREIQLVLLSATIDRPDLFASWLGDLKQKPIWLIPTKHRVVPLTHYVLRGNELMTIMDAKETFHEDAYNSWLRGLDDDKKKEKNFKQQVAAKNAAGDIGGLEGKTRTYSFTHRMNTSISMLKEKELLPALMFSFSRRDCEKYAAAVQGSLIDSSDAAAVTHIFDFHLRKHKQQLEKLQQFWRIRDFVIRGIAFHHSGLLPILKEVIEIIFAKGYIKVLFCTETFAVGINMPTKTAIFLSLTKHDDGGQRLLNTDEYIQMAGRAGRRGLDKVGTVIYLPDRDPITCYDMKRVMKSAMPSVSSRMNFGYEFILKTFHLGSYQWRTIMDNSYWYQQALGRKLGLKAEADEASKKASDVPLDAAMIDEFTFRNDLEVRIKSSTNSARKAAQKTLDQWKDKHMGPKWESGWKLWTQWKKHMNERDSLMEYVGDLEEQLENPISVLEPAIEYLKKIEFLKEDGQTLTPLGVMATEINEGHSLLMTRLYVDGHLDRLTAEEIVGVLGTFLSEKDVADEKTPRLEELYITQNVIDTIKVLHGIKDKLIDIELKYIPTAPLEYWSLSIPWIEIGYRWSNGENVQVLCEEFGLYEGNLMRGILKLANLVEELKALATLYNNVGLLEKLESIQLVRDVAVPDSLYLGL